ncbi:hypothetical protein LTR49_026041 [Elasticomyces elasticus]|nr:hypothetical protein LTR49_026041 [Elasticomyces elasticus]
MPKCSGCSKAKEAAASKRAELQDVQCVRREGRAGGRILRERERRLRSSESDESSESVGGGRPPAYTTGLIPDLGDDEEIQDIAAARLRVPRTDDYLRRVYRVGNLTYGLYSALPEYYPPWKCVFFAQKCILRCSKRSYTDEDRRPLTVKARSPYGYPRKEDDWDLDGRSSAPYDWPYEESLARRQIDALLETAVRRGLLESKERFVYGAISQAPIPRVLSPPSSPPRVPSPPRSPPRSPPSSPLVPSPSPEFEPLDALT